MIDRLGVPSTDLVHVLHLIVVNALINFSTHDRLASGLESISDGRDVLFSHCSILLAAAVLRMYGVKYNKRCIAIAVMMSTVVKRNFAVM